MSWDAEYHKYKQIWGERPSELALEASKRLIYSKGKPYRVLDIGCGYGRDTVFMAKSLGFRTLGIDISEKAIEMAKDNAINAQAMKAEFKLTDFRDVRGYFDVILVSNLYHLLPPEGRRDLAVHVTRLLAPEGRLFLNAISISDKEHYGIGTPVPGEENTWIDGKYIHLTTDEELRGAFPALKVKELYEHDYEEPHPGARTHYHKAWILVAEKSV
jgi:cyclopropane fatty-acyl-phospholipid synthase-like methyltransferase